MGDLSAFHGPNAGYVLDLYDRYLQDPAAIDAESRAIFDRIDPADVAALTAARPRTVSSPAPVATTAPTGPIFDVSAVVGAAALAQAIRDYGHLDVQLDPLGTPPHGAPELHPMFYSITDAQLATLPVEAVPWPITPAATNAKQAIDELRSVYSGGIGYDFDQVQIAEERAWLREAAENAFYTAAPTADRKRRLLKRLSEVEGFERFLHQTYLGQKRFSIEGTDALVPMMDAIILDAAGDGVREVVVGMAHRGRLNVLTHILGKPYAAIIAAFEGSKGRGQQTPPDSASDSGVTGDVKYHLGARLAKTADGKTVEVPLVLAPNPSHLEFVDPVVEGMARASQDSRSQPGPPPQDRNRSLVIMLHGDAAFPGQGIVSETLNLSGLPGYSTGGTIHIIVNNQIGFTTNYGDSRSTLYAGDLAKGFEIPVVHVNADDPISCLSAARMATAYRQRFGKDFLIDLVGYRRWGHNEGDEPGFTQPQMYTTVSRHPTVRQRFAQQLVADNVVSAEEAEGMLQGVLDHLASTRKQVIEAGGVAATVDENGRHDLPQAIETGVPAETLRAYDAAIHAVPKGMRLSSKLQRQWERRASVLSEGGDGKVDWAHGETLAFASILADGTPIRLSGQDSERGTFSQRHLVLHDATSGARWVALQTLPQAKASFAVYNSPLSEAATVGFEYGYTVHAPEALVLWEAQFGDFANGAQVLIDQFIVAAHAKWQQDPALVMLLPHGYEGQGPEHSSARLERFLQLYAQGSLLVANPTSSAQYFHLLRRQAKQLATDRRPLVVMTPKSLLRNPLAASELVQFTKGSFQAVLDDSVRAENPDAVTRLVFCSGKIGVELDSSPLRADAADVAVARIELLAPFPAEAVTHVVERYPHLEEVVWVQEEPRNMGAWSYIEPRLRETLGAMERPLPVRYVGRPERASPAEGSLDMHNIEQARIITTALTAAPVAVASNGGGRTRERIAKTDGAVRNGARTKSARASAGNN